MLAIALALLAAAEPVPSGEIAAIFTANDYPLDALMDGEKGRVAIEADVGPDGRVSACRITQSSGSSRLDGATCAIITRRARLTERARQHGGRPFTISTSVTWDTGPMGIPFVANAQKIIFTTGPAIGCRVEAPSWMSLPDACDVGRPSAEEALGRLARERNLDGLEYVIEMASIPGDHLADAKIGQGSGEILLGRRTALLTLGSDGRVVGCTGGEDTLGGSLSDWCSSFVTNEVYEPLPPGAEGQGERRLTKMQAIYLRPADPNPSG